MALRKQKSEEVADFFEKSRHLFATLLRSFAGAEGTTFWDYQNVPLKVDITDLSEFGLDWSAGDPRADKNCDGVVDIADLSLYTNWFTAGCP